MTVAIDTNLLVRLATNDDTAARTVVANLFDSEEVFIAKTVLLETEWVLRSRFQYAPRDIRHFFQHLLAASDVVFEDEPVVVKAVQLLAAGWDFADALHVASAGDRPFITMDRALVRKAKKSENPTVRLLAR